VKAPASTAGAPAPTATTIDLSRVTTPEQVAKLTVDQRHELLKQRGGVGFDLTGRRG
jgi:hypothetical protein